MTDELTDEIIDKSKKKPHFINDIKSDFITKHLLVPIEGFKMQDVIDEYRQVNIDFVKAIDRIIAIVAVKKISAQDLEYLESLDFYYHKRKLKSKYTVLLNKDIFKNILQATLAETIDKSIQLLGDPKQVSWEDAINKYRARFINYDDKHYENLIFRVNQLYSGLKNLYDDYEGVKNEFEELYSFSETVDIAQDITDLSERKQFYIQNIIDCKDFCLKEESFIIDEKQEEVFINKCKKAIEIIDLQLQNLSNTTIGSVTNDIAIEKNEKTATHLQLRIASKRKTDFIKLLSAMYDSHLFVDEDGKPITNKQNLMDTFGKFMNDDFSAYSTSLSQAKIRDEKTFLKPFKDIEKEALRYYNRVDQ